MQSRSTLTSTTVAAELINTLRVIHAPRSQAQSARSGPPPFRPSTRGPAAYSVARSTRLGLIEATSITLNASGLSLHALERNPGGNPPVLLLHGWLDHCHSFDWLCEALPASWRMLALDFRGHGRSGHLGQGYYHFTDYLGDVEAAVGRLGSVHLVAHSMGGAIGLLYSASQPARVRSLTVIESLGPMGGTPEDVVRRLQGYVAEMDKPSRRRTYATLEEAVHRVRENNSGLSPTAAEHLTRFGTQAVEGGLQFTFDPALRRRTAFVFDEAQILELLSGVRCPVQVIQASHGFTFDDAQMKARLARLGSPKPLLVEGGHHVHMDRPAEVAGHVRRFIEAH
jgi:pimeloyl-ACP methyl ester carboxylesterase